MEEFKEHIFQLENRAPTVYQIIHLFGKYIIPKKVPINIKSEDIKKFNVLFDDCRLGGMYDLIFLIFEYCLKRIEVIMSCSLEWEFGTSFELSIKDEIFEYSVSLNIHKGEIEELDNINIYEQKGHEPYSYGLYKYQEVTSYESFNPKVMTELLNTRTTNRNKKIDFVCQHPNYKLRWLKPHEYTSCLEEYNLRFSLDNCFIFREGPRMSRRHLIMRDNAAIFESFDMFIEIFRYLFDESFILVRNDFKENLYLMS